MLAAALLLALGAQASPPPAAVVVPLHISGLSGNESMGLALQVHQALAAGGVNLAMDPATALSKLGAKSEGAEACQAPEGCAVLLGRKLGAAIVIALDAAGSRKNCAMHLEALQVVDGAKVGELDLMSPRDNLKNEDRGALNGFAVALAPKLAALAPKQEEPKPSDLPRETRLDPAPKPEDPKVEIAKPTPAPGTKPAVVGTAVGAGVAAAAAIALGVVGVLGENELKGANPGFTYPEAQSKAGTVNAMYGGAGAAAGVAAVLAVVAVVLQVAD